MKILTLSNSPLEESQGSGYVILGYAKRLRELGHLVDVLGPRELLRPWRGSRAIRYRQMFGMAAASLARRRRGYDVFEFYGGEAWLAISLLRRLRRRPLLVAHSNGLEPLAWRLLSASKHSVLPRGWYRRDLSALYARAFRGVDGVVTVSEMDRDFAVEQGYQSPERTVCIENPLPDSYLDQPLEHDRPPAVVYCGWWIPTKNTDLIERDCAAFLEGHSEWRLVLAGVGPGFQVADHFSSRLAERVEVVPATDREQGLKAVYRRCRIAIQVSAYESFGLAGAEAMASGCALVATPVGFAKSLADGKEALLLSAAESPHLLRSLERLAADESFRRAVAAGGYQCAQRLRWGPAVERLANTYQAWLEVGRLRRPASPVRRAR